MKKESEGIYYTQGLAVPETPKQGEPPKPWRQTNVIGKRMPRVDAYERVSGTAVYPSDLVLPTCSMGPSSGALTPTPRSNRWTLAKRGKCRVFTP